jgi:hypothetical protein
MLRCLTWLLVGIMIALTALSAESNPPPWPIVERDMRPWSRWWWLGNIGDEKSLTAEMEKYAANGLGGLEITPIYGVRGYEDRFVPFLSTTWMRNFEHVLAEGRRLGLGIDLATGTGWPFGGPWVDDVDAAHYLAHKIYTVSAGARLTEPVTFIQRELIRYAGPRQTPIAELKQPIAANGNLQELAIDQVRFAQPLPIVSVMAFPSSGEPLDLTAYIRPDGQLNWTAPTDRGSWTVYALFNGQHGKMVERAGPGGEGYALDHLSDSALQRYLQKFDTAFANHETRGLRAFFNDSYEVDDAEGQADFTPAFFNEFARRRGYDLRRRLPDLFSRTETGASSRVLSDYRETISDLLLDNFTTPWRKWANAHDALIRNQPHGSPANVLDLYSASDIPEQEGNGILAMKLASSAAHLTGKKLVSAETATWLNEHFLSTLGELKSTVDTFLLGGINHNCYHGTAFSPPGEPWPGFQFYASVELSPTNPFWNDLTIVNAYVTRAQSFLQSGKPDEDVLLYYNIHDRWAERGDGSLPHFGHGRNPVGVTASEVAAELREQGLGFDYVSDRLLQNVAIASPLLSRGAESSARSTMLRSADATYRTIVVPATTFMPESTLEHLVSLADGGATILVLKQLPQDAPGIHERRDSFARLLARITENAVQQNGVTSAKIGAGQFLIGPDLESLLARRPDVSGETMSTLGFEYVRRRTDDGCFYFIVNRSEKIVEGWVPLQISAESAALFDPMTAQTGVPAFRSSATGPSQIYLQLAPNESCIVQLHRTAQATQRSWSYWQPTGEAVPLPGEWSVEFVRGGPALPPSIKLAAFKSWTEFGGEAAQAFSGTATYTLEFPRPSGDTAAWHLDLGTVADSARVKLNGREIAALVQAPWRVVVPANSLLERNTLQIEVTNLAANRIADLDRRGVPWKKFYNVNMPARLRENTGRDGLFTAAHWKPRASGLLGPVTLTPLRKLDPSSAPQQPVGLAR